MTSESEPEDQGQGMSEPSEPPSMKRWAVRGAAATGLSQIGRIGFQFASVIILARLLSPNDYGLVAMVLAIVGVGEMIRDLGLSAAAIRSETLSVGQRDNLWWLNTGLGALISVVVAACAPLIALLYGRSELVLITLALAPTFLLSGMSTQYRVGLTRDLAFGRLAIIDFSAAGVALAVGILTAFAGWHYWALVAQQVFGGVVALCFLWHASGWIPKAYDRTVSVRGFLNLGLSFLLGSVLAYFYRNIDQVLIGHRYGTESLGIYTRSVQMVRTPLNQLHGPFALVALPVMSKMGGNNERLVAAARRAQLALGYPVAYGCALIAAAATQVVSVALGAEWREAAPVMFWVAIGGGVATLTYSALWILTARAMAKLLNAFNISSTVLVLLGIGVGIFFGPQGVAAGVAAAAVAGFPLAFGMVSRGAGVPVRSIVLGSLRIAALAGAAGVVTRLALDRMTAGPAVELVAAVGIFVVWYAASLVLPRVRADQRELVAMLGALRGRD